MDSDDNLEKYLILRRPYLLQLLRNRSPTHFMALHMHMNLKTRIAFLKGCLFSLMNNVIEHGYNIQRLNQASVEMIHYSKQIQEATTNYLNWQGKCPHVIQACSCEKCVFPRICLICAEEIHSDNQCAHVEFCHLFE